MKKDRKELEKYLLNKCERIAEYPEQYKQIRTELLEKYNIPTGMTMDMIARGKVEEQTEHVLFCLLDGIKDIAKDKNVLEEFFMPVEIEKYSKTKIEKGKIKYPIVIKCIQTTEDQWIGATDTNFFMALRAEQKINYNENTQRTLTKIITQNGEYYKITVEEGTVKGIRGSLQRGEYIPTPITLNIPLESSSDFYYDPEQSALIINSLQYFDICDGYHRYVAMCREKDSNADFNCRWELRIINFTEDKARQFIYQEDQKTRMKKIDSDAMNMYNLANRITKNLNEDISFNLFGEINNAGGKISYSEFSKIIEELYLKGTKPENENALGIKIKNDLKSKFNYLTEIDENYLTRKYSYSELVVILYVFNNIEDIKNIYKDVESMLQNMKKIDKRKFVPNKAIAKSLLNNLEALYEEVR